MKRVFFFLAPAFLVFLFFLSGFFSLIWADSEAGLGWWDEDWQGRVRIEIENQAAIELPLGYTVSVGFDHASWVESGQSLVSGDDLRIVYQTEDGSWLEQDRILEEGSTWNDSETRILFSTAAVVPEEEIDNGYFLYFNNPQAGIPPADPERVFALFEDFEELEILPFPKHEWCSGGWCRTDHYVFPEVSADQAFSGSKSLKLTGPGSPSAVYLQSSIKDYSLRVKFYTIDPATEAGLYFRSWEFSAFCPLFAFYWDGFHLDTGRGLSWASFCRPPDCSFPQPGEWNRLEVKVVGKEILTTKFNGEPVEWLNPPENLELIDNQGDRLGFLYLFPWGQEPFPLYYDDLSLRRAVKNEPVLSLGEEEFLLPPPVPDLVSPEGNGWINLDQPLFDWEIAQEDEAETEGVNYQLEVGISTGFQEGEKRTVFVEETEHVFGLPFGEGEYFWRVKAIDGDREGAWSPIGRFFLDLSPPEVSWQEKPELKTEETRAKFVWQAEDNFSDGLVFSFRLDTGEWSEFGDQTEIVFDDLVEGEHLFAVRAKDEAGNLSREISFSWLVEIPPASLPTDSLVSGGETESQPVIFEVIYQERVIVKEVEIEGEDKDEDEESGEETLPVFVSSPLSEKGEILGEEKVGVTEARVGELGEKKKDSSKGETWLLVLEMAGLSSLLVAVGFFAARFR